MSGRGRLLGWTALVAALAALNYGSRAAGGKPERDVLYQYSTAIGGLLQYGIILAVVLALARPGAGQRLALRRPHSWGRAVVLAIASLLTVYAAALGLDAFLDAGGEQGLTPDGWNGDRAGAFAANFVVVALVAPIVEELSFRGLGFAVLLRFGEWPAILAIGLAFGLAHGLVQGLPILAVFGAALAFLRSRTGSVFPGMGVHALFNSVALVVAVTT